MSLAETRRYLRQVRFLGASPREAQTALHSKISYPFSNLILCLLGVPLSLRLRRSHRAAAAAVALAVGLVYVWFMEQDPRRGWPPLPAAGRLGSPRRLRRRRRLAVPHDRRLGGSLRLRTGSGSAPLRSERTAEDLVAA